MADPAIGEKIVQSWQLVDFPTASAEAITVIVFVIPITFALFHLIAANDRRVLVAEKEAHEKTKSKKQELENGHHRIKETPAKLEFHEQRKKQSEAWREVVLSDKEQAVFTAIAKGFLFEFS